MNGPGTLADIPPLVPSMLGGSAMYRGHRAHHSISSSSNSSTGWSALSDEEEDDSSSPHVNIEGESAFNDAYGEGSLKSSLHPHSALLYARRPSSTNHRSTIPLLHRRTSSQSSPLAVPVKSPLSGPASSLSVEDDLSDVPSFSLCSSVSSTRSRRDTVRPNVIEDNSEDSTVSKRRSRNRTSLPAYFSLLQSPSSPPSSRSSGSRQALASLSQSLRTSPTTPRTAHPILNLTHAHAEASSRPTAAIESTPRGRLQRRDPEARSVSGRRSLGRSPPRRSSRTEASSPPPYRQQHAVLGSQARARLDSVEKVFEWVSHSPVASGAIRGRTVTRRNSSPPPKHEIFRDPGAARDLHEKCKQEDVMDDEEAGRIRREDLRGRRKVEELDEAEIAPGAPGYGNGRSGLKARERPRGRMGGVW
ncbi:hypothetical protein EUX98_g7583 [Antrodiella citrinella]|uniref:Uncharacterized protein n=1 Tax=Antrodiella citrinella TaxID=2447956 RepID=A0A4V3XHT9_9APHY|nr:hypothetical protein EUX98_g7583 [Antrodiella citrinella]